MLNSYYRRVRNSLRNNPAIYQAYGFLRRVQHELELCAHTLKHKAGSGRASDGYTLPPPKLRYRVHGALSDKNFMVGGEGISRDIRRILSQHHRDLESCKNYLDFGCGSARILRHFFREHKNVQFFGTDIDAEAIEWDKKHFGDAADWQVNQPEPSLSYSDDQFDVIVSVSVFTHLDEELQFRWLQEISRVLAPGGIAILTIHGNSVWEAYPGMLRVMSEKGFHFLRKYVGFWRFDGLPNFYQVTFHSKDYIFKNWSRYFEISAYEEKAIAGHQCAVVLRKP